MENALNDPGRDPGINAELCMGDCDNCSYNIMSEEDKLASIIDAIYKCIEKKLDKILNPELLNFTIQEEDY